MNELLSKGNDRRYEDFIPAVRYSAALGSNVTGCQYKEILKNPVSFAYQIDMDVILGTRDASCGIVLSKKNILLLKKLETNDICGAEIDISYLIPKEKIGDVATLNQVNETYTLVKVESDGAPFWIAGFILGDACGYHKHLLRKYEDTEENRTNIQNQEMLRYIKERLQGFSSRKFNRRSGSYHSIKAYQNTVKRIMDSLKGYLDEKERRDIYLENAKIVNTFIAHRMEYPDRRNSNWLLASWAKNYLCHHYRRLMKIISQNILNEEDFSADFFNANGYSLKRRVLN